MNINISETQLKTAGNKFGKNNIENNLNNCKLLEIKDDIKYINIQIIIINHLII